MERGWGRRGAVALCLWVTGGWAAAAPESGAPGQRLLTAASRGVLQAREAGEQLVQSQSRGESGPRIRTRSTCEPL